MSKLFSELQRLYFYPSGCEENNDSSFVLPAKDGLTRAMLLRFKRSADWPSVAKLYEALQAELDLPAPAVSVSPGDGFQLWLSLAEPEPVARAQVFLAALCERYLGDLERGGVELFPADHTDNANTSPAAIDLVPTLDAASGRWSAFIDPSMGSVFIDEPGLEMSPNFDRQGQLLGQLQSIRPADFERVVDGIANRSDATPSEQAPARTRESGSTSTDQHFSDPQNYLLAVMNDPAATTKQKIKAAKALLPYF